MPARPRDGCVPLPLAEGLQHRPPAQLVGVPTPGPGVAPPLSARFGYEVDSSLLASLGTAADMLIVSGNLDIASGSLLSYTDITSGTVQAFVQDTKVFAMINYPGTWNGGLFTYKGTPLADGSRFTVGSQQWQIDYNSPTGGGNYTSVYLPSTSFVTVMAVPELGTLALAAVGVGLAVFAVRRWRASP
jgi:hypothetical protein